MSDNKYIIANEEVDFVVRNYESVKAINECLEQSKIELPAWVINKIISELKRQRHKFPEEYGRWTIDEYIEEGGFSIFPNSDFYDSDKELGMHFGVESISWESLTADYEENGAYIYLFYVMPSKKTKKFKDWQNAIIENTQKHRTKIISKNYIPEPDDSDHHFLVNTWLHEHLNIININNDPFLAIRNVAREVIEFMNFNITIMNKLP